MEKDLDKKLYNDYLKGNNQAFETLYIKYKEKIQFFVYNIVKDYQKAEDITQEVFIYLLKKPMDNKYSFKYHIYLIAKSKALDYFNKSKRREEINQIYTSECKENIEKDVSEIIESVEFKENVLACINELEDKYKNVVYLSSIEELSYIEISSLLGISVSNAKVMVHRGKKELKKILLKKGLYEMKKVSKIIVLLISISVLFTGITFGYIAYNNSIKKEEKLETRGLFDDGSGISYYEIDLMANDMTWQDDVRLYYRVLTNAEDYKKYKDRISEFPETDEIDFTNNFIVVVANENYRDFDEIDMEIVNIYSEDGTTKIVMKQKENPNMEDNSNVWYAIADKSELNDNVKIEVEHKKFYHQNIKELSGISENYSTNEAISDGCIVVEENKIISEDKDAIDKFITSTENGEKAFIRVYNKYNNEIEIKDINFENGIYYIDTIEFQDGNLIRTYHSTYKKLDKINTSDEKNTNIIYMFSQGRNPNSNEYLAIIQNWLKN